MKSVAILPIELYKTFRAQDQRRKELEANPLLNKALDIDKRMKQVLKDPSTTQETKTLLYSKLLEEWNSIQDKRLAGSDSTILPSSATNADIANRPVKEEIKEEGGLGGPDGGGGGPGGAGEGGDEGGGDEGADRGGDGDEVFHQALQHLPMREQQAPAPQTPPVLPRAPGTPLTDSGRKARANKPTEAERLQEDFSHWDDRFKPDYDKTGTRSGGRRRRS